MISIYKRKIWLCILLSIVTLGIYQIRWMYLLVKNIKAIHKDTSSCVGEMLCLVFVPFYSYYWWVTRGKSVSKKFAEENNKVIGNEIVYLIFAILGLNIVSMSIMQNDFNSFESEFVVAIYQNEDSLNIIIKLLVNQLGITIFSYFLYTAASAFANTETKAGEWSVVNTIHVFISIFSFLFYFVLVYYAMWEIGAKDKIRIDGGRLEPMPLKGLLLGVYAYIPSVAIVLLGVLFSGGFLIENAVGGVSNFADVVDNVTASRGSVFGVLMFAFTILIRIVFGMYLGVIQGLSTLLSFALHYGRNSFMDDFVQNLLYLIVPLVGLLVIHFAYKMGAADKKLFGSSKPSAKR